MGGDVNKYRFETSSVEIFALSDSVADEKYLIVVKQSHQPTRVFQFNDGMHPYRLEFDCQREVMSISTQQGTFDKKFAAIGVKVSERYDPAPVQVPGLNCNEVMAVPLTKTEARIEYDGRAWNSDYAFEGSSRTYPNGDMILSGGVNEYRFKTSSTEIFALTEAKNRDKYLIVVRQSHQPTQYFQFNDGMQPYRLAFDCQRGVVSIATLQGTLEKKFAAIGAHVSAGLNCNEVMSVPLAKTEARIEYDGRAWNSDYAFFEGTYMQFADGGIRPGGVNKYRFKTSSTEIFALTEAENR